MTAKQLNGSFAPDGSKYGTLTDGDNFLMDDTNKQNVGKTAPDGSAYLTETDGAGNLL